MSQTDTDVIEEPVVSMPETIAHDSAVERMQSGVDRDQVTPEELAEPPSDSFGTSIAALGERIGLLYAEMAEVKALLTQFSRATELNRAAFDRLHKEMLDYKEDFLQQAQQPVYKSLILLSDNIRQVADQERPITAGDCHFLLEQVDEILYRQGVEPMTCEGDEFDSGRQRALRTELTIDETQHRRVARRLQRGYLIGERVLRPEGVVVLVYQPQPDSESSPEPVSSTSEGPK